MLDRHPLRTVCDGRRPALQLATVRTRQHPAAIRHGVFSGSRAERVAAEVEALAEQVAVRYPWTRPYDDERRSYARALLDEQSIRDYLDEVGHLDARKRERPAVRTLDRFHNHAESCRDRLGLNSASHARLLVMVSEVVKRHPDGAGPLESSLGPLLAEGRAALERGAERNGEAS